MVSFSSPSGKPPPLCLYQTRVYGFQFLNRGALGGALPGWSEPTMSPPSAMGGGREVVTLQLGAFTWESGPTRPLWASAVSRRQ